MRTPHFVLAAIVALATSFSLRAAAWHHFHGWHREPLAHRSGWWGPRFDRGFGPAGCGPHSPARPVPLPGRPPADSLPGTR